MLEMALELGFWSLFIFVFLGGVDCEGFSGRS